MGAYFVAAIQPGFQPDFALVNVPSTPDLKRGHFEEAEEVDFLLVQDYMGWPDNRVKKEYLRSRVAKVAGNHVSRDRPMTPPTKDPNVDKWIPKFMKLLQRTEEIQVRTALKIFIILYIIDIYIYI